MTYENFRPIVEATRGPIVESVHFGAIAVVNYAGKLLAHWGDPQTITYLRSSSKPIQVLPFVEAGGVEKFALNDQELSLMCASHSGTDEHVAVAESIQKKIGVNQSQLLCGTHPISHDATRRAMILRGEEPSPNRHNCSGKHSGFLAHAILRGFSTEDYINPEHPLQKIVIQTFAEMCSFPVEKIAVGIDGCSAPVFGVPLYNAALAFARLVNPVGLDEKRAVACRKITHAMNAFPEMISDRDSFDSMLMRIMGGKLITKTGAEGYQSIGIMPGVISANHPGLGIAIKISDGDPSDRARPVVSLELLRQLGALTPAENEALKKFDRRAITNWRKINVGELRPCFKLALDA